MHRVLLITMICCLLLPAALETRAEVSVKTDRAGRYVTTVIVPGGTPWNPGIWSPRTRAAARRGRTLNALGDMLGDLRPTIAENPVAPHHPWVAWSRHNGDDFDLAWSAWTTYGWSTIAPVFSSQRAGNDLDPDVLLTRGGEAYLVWWNDSHPGGGIFLSKYEGGGWTNPLELSDPQSGGRYPSLSLDPRGRVQVTYKTLGRIVTISLNVGDPVTITDDIDPQSPFSDDETTVHIGQRD